MNWQHLSEICSILLAVANISLVAVVFIQRRHMREQVSAMSATNALNLLLRLDERLCTQENKNLQNEMKVWDPKSIPNDKKDLVNDLIGIFELVGLAAEKKYIPIEDAEIMFGGPLLRIYDDYGYSTYIEKSPLYFNYTKRFAKDIREIAKKRKEGLKSFGATLRDEDAVVITKKVLDFIKSTPHRGIG